MKTLFALTLLTTSCAPRPDDEALRKITDSIRAPRTNPFVWVDSNGYILRLNGVFGAVARLNKVDELEALLLQLPLECWPLGKVVTMSPKPVLSGPPESQQRQRQDDYWLALVKMLKSHNIQADMIPPA